MSATLQEIFNDIINSYSQYTETFAICHENAVKEVFAVLQKRLHYYKSICDITKI